MRPFEFLIPRRPLSIQADPRKLQKWKAFINETAKGQWTGEHERSAAPVCATLLHFYEKEPPDIDNIVKPILDALNGLVFDDDAAVSDLIVRRRPLGGEFDLRGVSSILIEGIEEGREFVYVHVCDAPPKEKFT